MAEVAAPAAATLNTNAQVPLDTIPISPADGQPSGNSENTKPASNGSDLVTVFHDADNFNVKHPLANVWSLWFTKPPTGKGDNWNDLLKEVMSFDSVEEFWGLYNNVAPVSSLPPKADYHLFKQGVRPEWEDPQNKHGGKWAYTTKDRKNINELWLQVMLAAIGETLEDETDDEVMGVVVNVRRGFWRIGLWTRTIGKQLPSGRTADQGREVLMRIGKRFKDNLDLPEAEQVDFTGHSDSAHAGSTRARAKMVV